MKCPVDDTTLQMTDRSGIEIDYCPQCRGVWLDRGELDKLIERASPPAPPAPAPAPAAAPPRGDERRYEDRRYEDRRYDRRDEDRRDDWQRRDGGYPPKRKKKSSMLSELFDF